MLPLRQPVSLLSNTFAAGNAAGTFRKASAKVETIFHSTKFLTHFLLLFF